MFAAPTTSLFAFGPLRASTKPRRLADTEIHQMLRAALALEDCALLAIGPQTCSGQLCRNALLARLRRVHKEVLEQLWHWANEAEHGGELGRPARPEFVQPHALVVGLLAAWELDAATDGIGVAQRMAQARFHRLMTPSERVARLWATRILCNGAHPLDVEALAAAADQLEPLVRPMLRNHSRTLSSAEAGELVDALNRLHSCNTRAQQHAGDAADLFVPAANTPTPAPASPLPAAPSAAVCAISYAPAGARTPRQVSPRLPGTHRVNSLFDTASRHIAGLHGHLQGAYVQLGSLPVPTGEGLRGAALGVLQWPGLPPREIDCAGGELPGHSRTGWPYGLGGVFGSASGSSAGSSAPLTDSESSTSIDEGWCVVDASSFG